MLASVARLKCRMFGNVYAVPRMRPSRVATRYTSGQCAGAWTSPWQGLSYLYVKYVNDSCGCRFLPSLNEVARSGLDFALSTERYPIRILRCGSNLSPIPSRYALLRFIHCITMDSIGYMPVSINCAVVMFFPKKSRSCLIGQKVNYFKMS